MSNFTFSPCCPLLTMSTPFVPFPTQARLGHVDIQPDLCNRAACAVPFQASRTPYHHQLGWQYSGIPRSPKNHTGLPVHHRPRQFPISIVPLYPGDLCGSSVLRGLRSPAFLDAPSVRLDAHLCPRSRLEWGLYLAVCARQASISRINRDQTRPTC